MINIGNRRELFVDDYLIDGARNEVPQVICRPQKREPVFVHDAKWEKTDAVYHNIVRTPEGKFRMYYKAAYDGWKPDGAFAMIRRICVIESDDGLHWTRPRLTLTPIPEGEVNNIISGIHDFYDNMYVFYDENPACPEDERYKAFYGEWGNALFMYTSADGINFRFHPEKREDFEWPRGPFGVYPPIGDPRRSSTISMTCVEAESYFDSLNTVYWSKEKGKYVAFVRGFHVADDNFPKDPDVPEAVRDIRYSESDDLRNWSKPRPLRYNDDFDYQLYTNAVQIYYRAPHIMIGYPTRYTAREDWNDSFERLCGAEARRHRGRGQSITDAIFMSSRDGLNWNRTGEAMFVPGPEHGGNWIYGDAYSCVGCVESPGPIAGSDPVLSFFCKENIEDGPRVLYRYELRVDGFACRRSTYAPQKLVTKPFIYDGDELEINFATSAAGYIKFTLACEDGREIHTSQVFGDKIDRIVGFDDGSPADFRGKPVVLTAEMSDASLYAIKFN